MHRSLPRAALAASILAFAVSTAHAAGWTVEGRVVGVQDGDTVTVLDQAKAQHRIRLSGIDAPEKRQGFGERSKQHLSDLVFQKPVEARCHKKDRYGREVCAVFVGQRDVGLEQIRAGLAWWYREYAHEQSPQDRLAYETEEDAARRERLGLWQDQAPVAPWDWRRRSGHRTSSGVMGEK